VHGLENASGNSFSRDNAYELTSSKTHFQEFAICTSGLEKIGRGCSWSFSSKQCAALAQMLRFDLAAAVFYLWDGVVEGCRCVLIALSVVDGRLAGDSYNV